LTAANEVASHLRGHYGAPLRREFMVRPERSEPTPLNQLMSSQAAAGGGRGGRQRLALLLTALWVCSKPPHSTKHSASWWAEMIGLPEPRGQAAGRSVVANLRELDRRGYITLEAGRNGLLPEVSLRSELGTGEPYVRPHLDPYPSFIRVPETLWTRGLIGELDARALAMYLVLIYYTNLDARNEIWFSNTAFRERHGMAEATRLNGLNKLVNLGVATMREDYVDAVHDVGYRTIKRRFYRLDPLYIPPSTSKRDATPKVSNTDIEPNPVNQWPEAGPETDPWGSFPTANQRTETKHFDDETPIF
jgi:hypothetical protein